MNTKPVLEKTENKSIILNELSELKNEIENLHTIITGNLIDKLQPVLSNEEEQKDSKTPNCSYERKGTGQLYNQIFDYKIRITELYNIIENNIIKRLEI